MSKLGHYATNFGKEAALWGALATTAIGVAGCGQAPENYRGNEHTAYKAIAKPETTREVDGKVVLKESGPNNTTILVLEDWLGKRRTECRVMGSNLAFEPEKIGTNDYVRIKYAAEQSDPPCVIPADKIRSGEYRHAY
jgi:hypothetical protein